MTILEWLFVALFSIETLLRMSAYRFCFFFDKHNLLDAALLVFSIVEIVLSSLANSYFLLLRVRYG